MPNEIFRLTSPYGKSDNDARNVKRVQCDIPVADYSLLFHGYLQAVRGSQFFTLTTFIHALIQECKSNGLPTTYDPDNESSVARILSRINFNDTTSVADAAYSRGYNDGLAAAANEASNRLARGTTTEPSRSDTGRNVGRGSKKLRKGSS